MVSRTYKSFEYRFRDQKLYEDYCSLYCIGFEYLKNPELYYHDCNRDPEKMCVFQYTVSGEGTLVVEKTAHTIRAGQAFIIEKPGPYTYYLPKKSDHWEVKYLGLNLKSINIWSDLTRDYGRILQIDGKSDVMKYWDHLYNLSLEDKMDNFFMSSAYAYTFMMKLNYTLKKSAENKKNVDIIQRCTDVIYNNYMEDLSLQELSDICMVSPSQLTKKFKQSYKVSPIQYLINHRIKVACSLLLRSNSKIQNIAVMVGFKDANYFSRVFHNQMGMSPREYREQECNKIVRSKETEHMYLEIPPDVI